MTDIEESVWAPKYGIKGNVDASLTVAFEAAPAAVLAPFEFKTGKPHHSHRAQARVLESQSLGPRVLGPEVYEP